MKLLLMLLLGSCLVSPTRAEPLPIQELPSDRLDRFRSLVSLCQADPQLRVGAIQATAILDQLEVLLFQAYHAVGMYQPIVTAIEPDPPIVGELPPFDPATTWRLSLNAGPGSSRPDDGLADPARFALIERGLKAFEVSLSARSLELQAGSSGEPNGSQTLDVFADRVLRLRHEAQLALLIIQQSGDPKTSHGLIIQGSALLKMLILINNYALHLGKDFHSAMLTTNRPPIDP